jgi:hypothetical protein
LGCIKRWINKLNTDKNAPEENKEEQKVNDNSRMVAEDSDEIDG